MSIDRDLLKSENKKEIVSISNASKNKGENKKTMKRTDLRLNLTEKGEGF